MFIDTSYEIDSFSIWEGCDQHTNWLGKEVYRESPDTVSAALAIVIHNNQPHMDNLIKPMGEGSYEVKAEKSSDGNASVGGSISYETDSGITVEAEAKVDSQGSSSGSVSISGKF